MSFFKPSEEQWTNREKVQHLFQRQQSSSITTIAAAQTTSITLSYKRVLWPSTYCNLLVGFHASHFLVLGHPLYVALILLNTFPHCNWSSTWFCRSLYCTFFNVQSIAMLPPRAYLFIGLNAVRILSIISLILVFASSIFVMVKDVEAFNEFQAQTNGTSMQDCDYIPNSDVPNQPAGIFWAVINRVLILFEVIALILCEIGWPLSFFDRFFPVLGSSFGLGALGIFQCLIGATILSHHVDDFTLVAAFFLFSIGCVNMLLGLVFRESAKTRRSILSWREQAKGVLPTTHDLRPQFARPASSSVVANLFKNKNDKAQSADEFGRKGGYGFGRQGEKHAGLKGFLISKPMETVPRYATSMQPERPASLRAATPEPKFKSSNTAI